MHRVIRIAIVLGEEDNMNVVKTIAPIAIDDLKKYFTDKNTSYEIGYKDSGLKGSKLITYLSNLDIPSDISFVDCTDDDVYGFLKDYLHSKMLVSIPSVEAVIIEILLQRKGLSKVLDEKFIQENAEILDEWINKLDSLTLYNMYIVMDDTFKEYVTSFEEDSTDDLEGINFISLLKHPFFYDLYNSIDKSKLKYYSKYFNEYMFKGKSLYSFWANENNPLFLLTYTISNGDMDSKKYVKAVETSIKEIADATSVQ